MSNGIYDLGNMITKKIDVYAHSGSERDLNKIFRMLIELGTIIIKTRYRGSNMFVMDDAVQQIAEDMLMAISKQPKHFLYLDNFYPYYRCVVLGRSAQLLKEFYKSYRHVTSMNELTNDARAILWVITPLPIDNLAKKDSYGIFIKRVYSKLRSCHRFSKQPGYLLWPMILSILYGENQMFDSLDYRDRIALRVVQTMIYRKAHLYD